MKKIIPIIILILLAISVYAGISLNNKQSALDYLTNYKATPVIDTNQFTYSLDIVSDKICIINYETEIVESCNIGVEFEFDKAPIGYERIYSTLKHIQYVDVPEYSTAKDDDVLIKKHFEDYVKTLFPKPEIQVEFVKEVRIGDII